MFSDSFEKEIKSVSIKVSYEALIIQIRIFLQILVTMTENNIHHNYPLPPTHKKASAPQFQ